MRRFLYAFICISLFCCCEENSPFATLELSQDVIECTMTGGEYQITTNRPDWTTDNTSKWISIRKHESSAIITVDRNNGKERTYTIGFKVYDRQMASLKIVQEHSDQLQISSEYEQASYKGDTLRINLTCFAKWKVSVDSDWLSTDITEGDSPAEICIIAARNQHYEARKGKVTFSSGDRKAELTIMQEMNPYVEIDTDLVEIDGDGGQTFVLYMSNTEVVISCEHDWIRLIKTDGAIKKVSFEVKRNLSETREGCIKVSSAADADIYRTITIRQGPKIDHPALSFEEGTYLELSSKDPLTLHPVFVDMSDRSLIWKSDDTSVAEVDVNGNITIRRGGECIITASNAHHGVEASIILKIMPKAVGMMIYFGEQDMDENPIAARFIGEKISINVTLDPEDAYTGDLTYFSSDDSVASIEGNTIHCLKNGKAEIYIESIYHSLRKSYTVIVLK